MRWDYVAEKSSLDSQWILIDGDDVLGLQNSLHFGFNRSQIVGHDQRSGQNRPQSHLSSTLLVTEAEIANNQLNTQERKKERKKKQGNYAIISMNSNYSLLMLKWNKKISV